MSMVILLKSGVLRARASLLHSFTVHADIVGHSRRRGSCRFLTCMIVMKNDFGLEGYPDGMSYGDGMHPMQAPNNPPPYKGRVDKVSAVGQVLQRTCTGSVLCS